MAAPPSPDLDSKATSLQNHYARYGVDVESSLSSRFIRLNPRWDAKETIQRLNDEASTSPTAVDWLHGFYALPADFSLSKSPCFREGRVYGQDVSSGAAAAALVSDRYDTEKGSVPPGNCHVLDLCCAPGLKLCALSDALPGAQLTGVDISENRLHLTAQILRKYRVPNVRLYRDDGRTFSPETATLMHDSVVAEEILHVGRKRKNKSARARERKRLKACATETPVDGYDRVLVDAECSTDGSIKHLQKQPTSLMEREPELVELQKGLLEHGFSLLKPNGWLVYSTCSLSEAQNENVVQWLLDKYSEAQLIEVSFGTDRPWIRDGTIKGTVRFTPHSDPLAGGGFFLAKLRRTPDEPP